MAFHLRRWGHTQIGAQAALLAGVEPLGGGLEALVGSQLAQQGLGRVFLVLVTARQDRRPRQQGATLDQQQPRADADEVDQPFQLLVAQLPHLIEVLAGHLHQRDGGDVQLLALDEVEQQVQRAAEDGQFDAVLIHRGRITQ